MGAFLANAHRALHMPTRATSYRYAICADGKASLHWRHHELYNSTVAENAAKPADLSDSCRFANRNGLAVVLVGGDASCVLEFDFCIHNVVTNAPVSLAELAEAGIRPLIESCSAITLVPIEFRRIAEVHIDPVPFVTANDASLVYRAYVPLADSARAYGASSKFGGGRVGQRVRLSFVGDSIDARTTGDLVGIGGDGATDDLLRLAAKSAMTREPILVLPDAEYAEARTNTFAQMCEAHRHMLRPHLTFAAQTASSPSGIFHVFKRPLLGATKTTTTTMNRAALSCAVSSASATASAPAILPPCLVAPLPPRPPRPPLPPRRPLPPSPLLLPSYSSLAALSLSKRSETARRAAMLAARLDKTSDINSDVDDADDVDQTIAVAPPAVVTSRDVRYRRRLETARAAVVGPAVCAAAVSTPADATASAAFMPSPFSPLSSSVDMSCDAASMSSALFTALSSSYPASLLPPHPSQLPLPPPVAAASLSSSRTLLCTASPPLPSATALSSSFSPLSLSPMHMPSPMRASAAYIGVAIASPTTALRSLYSSRSPSAQLSTSLSLPLSLPPSAPLSLSSTQPSTQPSHMPLPPSSPHSSSSAVPVSFSATLTSSSGSSSYASYAALPILKPTTTKTPKIATRASSSLASSSSSARASSAPRSSRSLHNGAAAGAVAVAATRPVIGDIVAAHGDLGGGVGGSGGGGNIFVGHGNSGRAFRAAFDVDGVSTAGHVDTDADAVMFKHTAPFVNGSFVSDPFASGPFSSGGGFGGDAYGQFGLVSALGRELGLDLGVDLGFEMHNDVATLFRLQPAPVLSPLSPLLPSLSSTAAAATASLPLLSLSSSADGADLTSPLTFASPGASLATPIGVAPMGVSQTSATRKRTSPSPSPPPAFTLSSLPPPSSSSSSSSQSSSYASTAAIAYPSIAFSTTCAQSEAIAFRQPHTHRRAKLTA